MKVGYSRVSTVDLQNYSFEHQQDVLKTNGCGKLFNEKASSIGKRPIFEELMEFLRNGDSLVITKLDRLARSIKDLTNILATLDEKGVNLVILDMNLDTTTPTGRLMINLLGSIAQFERELLLERQKIGIQKAKEQGKYKGRKPTAMSKTPIVERLLKNGMKNTEIADELNIGIASVYRIKKALANN